MALWGGRSFFLYNELFFQQSFAFDFSTYFRNHLVSLLDPSSTFTVPVCGVCLRSESILDMNLYTAVMQFDMNTSFPTIFCSSFFVARVFFS